MAAVKEGSIVFCKTCGIAAIHPGHLCNPAPIPPEEAFVCDYCGRVVTDPLHICKPMALKVDYTCQDCGRVSDRKDKLCNPVEMED